MNSNEEAGGGAAVAEEGGGGGVEGLGKGGWGVKSDEGEEEGAGGGGEGGEVNVDRQMKWREGGNS